MEKQKQKAAPTYARSQVSKEIKPVSYAIITAAIHRDSVLWHPQQQSNLR